MIRVTEAEKNAAISAYLAAGTAVIQEAIPIAVEAAFERAAGRLEQDFENEQVRRFRKSGRCPCCGAESWC